MGVKVHLESPDVQKPYVKVTRERNFGQKGGKKTIQNGPTLSQWHKVLNLYTIVQYAIGNGLPPCRRPIDLVVLTLRTD